MSVWLCIPSKRPPEEAEKVLKLWRERGYKIALLRDEGECGKLRCDYENSILPYPGYAAAVNSLIRDVLCLHPEAEWLVTGGDDVQPDMNHSAEEIARQCSEKFYVHFELMYPPLRDKIAGWSASATELRTFGVMQPTGDRWGDRQGPYIERVCGSPWMGREFCRRVYGGRGPLFEGYFHMGEDEELQAVAQKVGVLWQRPDLIHFHNHWGRKNASGDDMPKFLERANDPKEWAAYKKLFAERQAAGFPGHEPLEA